MRWLSACAMPATTAGISRWTADSHRRWSASSPCPASGRSSGRATATNAWPFSVGRVFGRPALEFLRQPAVDLVTRQDSSGNHEHRTLVGIEVDVARRPALQLDDNAPIEVGLARKHVVVEPRKRREHADPVPGGSVDPATPPTHRTPVLPADPAP